MTERNKFLRDKIRSIETLAMNCLRTQPEEDEACEVHLAMSLAKIAEMSEEFHGKTLVDVYDIVWDTDDEDPNDLGLPKSMRLMVDLVEGNDIAEDIANMLSDRSGWCVKSLKYRMV